MAVAAVISNGDEQNILGEFNQAFIVSNTALKITGKIRFVTNELAPYLKSFDDMFLISLKSSDSDLIILQGNTQMTPLQQGVGGYQFASDVIPFEVSLVNKRGQKVSLNFKVLDVDDMIVDSGIVITDLSLVEE